MKSPDVAERTAVDTVEQEGVGTVCGKTLKVDPRKAPAVEESTVVGETAAVPCWPAVPAQSAELA